MLTGVAKTCRSCFIRIDPSKVVDADTLATAFKALSDPVRLRLLSLIGTVDEMCACDLPEMVDRTQPTVSHHVKILVEAGPLTREQCGKWAWFRPGWIAARVGVRRGGRGMLRDP